MKQQPTKGQAAAQRAALSSALRIELVSLFGGSEELSVSDMAARTGRRATSLYHHLTILEDAGILREAGTRPKGKRFETVYGLVDSMVELELDNEDETARDQLSKTMATVFRKTGRDFAAALLRDDLLTEGPGRNFIAGRLHMRAGPEMLADINERLSALYDVVAECAASPAEPGPDDKFLSLTLALLPLPGRSVDPVTDGDES